MRNKAKCYNCIHYNVCKKDVNSMVCGKNENNCEDFIENSKCFVSNYAIGDKVIFAHCGEKLSATITGVMFDEGQKTYTVRIDTPIKKYKNFFSFADDCDITSEEEEH